MGIIYRSVTDWCKKPLSNECQGWEHLVYLIDNTNTVNIQKKEVPRLKLAQVLSKIITVCMCIYIIYLCIYIHIRYTYVRDFVLCKGYENVHIETIPSGNLNTSHLFPFQSPPKPFHLPEEKHETESNQACYTASQMQRSPAWAAQTKQQGSEIICTSGHNKSVFSYTHPPSLSLQCDCINSSNHVWSLFFHLLEFDLDLVTCFK